jgi:hypothetical protein
VKFQLSNLLRDGGSGFVVLLDVSRCSSGLREICHGFQLSGFTGWQRRFEKLYGAGGPEFFRLDCSTGSCSGEVVKNLAGGILGPSGISFKTGVNLLVCPWQNLKTVDW